jgi:hypothetical protein
MYYMFHIALGKKDLFYPATRPTYVTMFGTTLFICFESKSSTRTQLFSSKTHQIPSNFSLTKTETTVGKIALLLVARL